ncbi:monovalent cation/H+ antiporter subunit D [Billgrantia endophytica]|uniref:Monovalent cation/H+ antiporter subunit D n=1 Tax=Billgrantia endophytica TaxID=2033802 RepID=A0A2N7U890_9GAMM|nr:monovalent cation/H+ antiporter subunit D [Halomonas endophytica]PMR76654.1 monovalent cation/H+ antiporter subunit D [Halomonas endophytica]
MSQHLVILPILMPMIGALILLLSGKAPDGFHRRLSVALTGALLLISLVLLGRAASGELLLYALGNWQAPFGIVLMLDRLSALMLVLTATLALGCVLFACAGEDIRGSHFHGLFQLQLMGLNGAFLTSDLFNLFIFFEITLLASYALLMHGGGKEQVAAGLHYVVINVAGSALFVISLGVLYGATGTLNMADMANRVAEMGSDQAALVTAGALMLIVVFSLKAALLPLYFWLPRTYAAAPAPVAALFAIMTKLGLYAILRVQSMIFVETPAAAHITTWLWWSGLATIALAGVGVLAARDLRPLIAYLVLVSVGTLLAGVAMGTTEATTALLYYLPHTTLICGALFLIAELIGQQRGKAGTRLVRARRLHQRHLLGGLFLVAAVAVAGLPPLAGSISKLMLMQAVEGSARLWLWPLLLLAGLCALIAMSRAGSVFFWASYKGEVVAGKVGRTQLAGVIWLLASVPVLVAFGGPIGHYTQATAEQLASPQAVIHQLLEGGTAPDLAQLPRLPHDETQGEAP